jgi:Protein of unknown function (DUF3027)
MECQDGVVKGDPAPRPNDEAFQRDIHERWVERQHRPMSDPEYRDEWCAEQCGGCRFWIPLSGVLGDDYGACANAASPRDGRVQFEHDGCESFAPVSEGDWGRAPS